MNRNRNDRRIIVVTSVALLALCLVFGGCAKQATETGQQRAAPASSNQQRQIASTDVVKATPQELTITKGQSSYVVVALEVQQGYHINANPPTFSYLKATELEVNASNGISVEFVTYPNAITKQFPFADKPLAVYEGQTEIKAMLKADNSANTGQHNLRAKLRVQACDDQVCYAPGAIDLAIPVTVK